MLWFSMSLTRGDTEQINNHPGANEAESTEGVRGAHTKSRGRTAGGQMQRVKGCRCGEAGGMT